MNKNIALAVLAGIAGLCLLIAGISEGSWLMGIGGACFIATAAIRGTDRPTHR